MMAMGKRASGQRQVYKASCLADIFNELRRFIASNALVSHDAGNASRRLEH